MKKLTTLAALVGALLLTNCSKDKRSTGNQPTTPATLTDRVLTENLTLPWEILWGPDNQLWITERSGKISRIDPSTGRATALLTINEVVSRGEGGLLGMVLHPDFTTTPEVFVAYNYLNGNNYLKKVVKYTFRNNALSNPLRSLIIYLLTIPTTEPGWPYRQTGNCTSPAAMQQTHPGRRIRTALRAKYNASILTAPYPATTPLPAVRFGALGIVIRRDWYLWAIDFTVPSTATLPTTK